MPSNNALNPDVPGRHALCRRKGRAGLRRAGDCERYVAFAAWQRLWQH
jgi:hypothetical protein